MKILKATAINAMVLLMYLLLSTPSYAHALFQHSKFSVELDKNWQFTREDSINWLPATVPGCVHTDLRSNMLIPDPFWGTNETMLQWIDKKNWMYQTHFDVPDAIWEQDSIDLHFKGLDTYADIYINNHFLLHTDNMFRAWHISCKKYLTKKNNIIEIKFQSPIMVGLEKLKENGYPLPASNDQAKMGQVPGDAQVSVFTRKAPYQYGWDWGPRFVSMGIGHPITLEGWSVGKIENVYINNVFSSNYNKDTITAYIQVFVTQKGYYSVNLELNNGIEKKIRMDTALNPGTQTVPLKFVLNNPKLWWCAGYGSPHLYNISCQLYFDGTMLSINQFTYGFRNIRLVQDKDSIGRGFKFVLNGVPVFAKGANYIPNDIFQTRVTKDKYDFILSSAHRSNMNMLRVWGGGNYEDDYFYHLCDKYGILIWQEFMFACSMYPGDPDFLASVTAEAKDNIIRLRNHPCIALWCGNNEIDAAWHYWGEGWRDSYSPSQQKIIWGNYLNIFDTILCHAVAKYSPQVDYVESSPLAYHGANIPANQIAEQEQLSGDMHFWSVWHGKKPFSEYAKHVGRFMTEYGFQSFPSMQTIATFANASDWNINSPVMLDHQRSPPGNGLIKIYMDRDYQDPKNFSSFVYLSQVLQAEGIKQAIEAHRRSMPYCMGTLYWQLNDCWPAPSWSSIDNTGTWKALQYFAKKVYNPILVSPVMDSSVCKIYVVSDEQKSVTAKLLIRVFDFLGTPLYQKKIPIEIAPASSSIYFTIPKMDEVQQQVSYIRKAYMDIKVLGENNQILSEAIQYFAPVKQLLLPKPKLRISVITKNKNGFLLSLESKNLVKNLYLSTQSKGIFTDNFFDLLPYQKRRVYFSYAKDEKYRSPKFKIQSIYDTYNH